MSLPVLLLECGICKESVPEGPYLPALYCTPDGKHLALRWTLGWCNSCGHARRVEDWPSLEALDNETAKALKMGGESQDQLHGWMREKLEDIETYRRLQPLRTTSNHCLSCGGTDLLAWSYDNDGVPVATPHKDCTGLFRQVEDPDGMRFMLVDECDLFSLDCRDLGRVQNNS